MVESIRRQVVAAAGVTSVHGHYRCAADGLNARSALGNKGVVADATAAAFDSQRVGRILKVYGLAAETVVNASPGGGHRLADARGIGHADRREKIGGGSCRARGATAHQGQPTVGDIDGLIARARGMVDHGKTTKVRAGAAAQTDTAIDRGDLLLALCPDHGPGAVPAGTGSQVDGPGVDGLRTTRRGDQECVEPACVGAEQAQLPASGDYHGSIAYYPGRRSRRRKRDVVAGEQVDGRADDLLAGDQDVPWIGHVDVGCADIYVPSGPEGNRSRECDVAGKPDVPLGPPLRGPAVYRGRDNPVDVRVIYVVGKKARIRKCVGAAEIKATELLAHYLESATSDYVVEAHRSHRPAGALANLQSTRAVYRRGKTCSGRYAAPADIARRH